MLLSLRLLVFLRLVDREKLLWCALQCQNVRAARLLLDSGVQVNARDPSGWTPLHLAAMSGRNDLVSILLDNGAEVNAREEQEQKTPLHLAAARENKDLTSLLLDNGAEVSSKDWEGKTALHLAAEKGSADNVALLLDKGGAEVDARDANGRTPLHLVSRCRHKEIISLLVGSGAKINARDKDDSTALHLAARLGDRETLSALILFGCSVAAKDDAINSQLHVALKVAQTADLPGALHPSGHDCSCDMSNLQGETPLLIACRQREEYAKTLIDAGFRALGCDFNKRSALYFASRQMQNYLFQGHLIGRFDLHSQICAGELLKLVLPTHTHLAMHELTNT